MRKRLMKGICILMVLMAGCAGYQKEVTEEPVDAVVSADEAGSDISDNEIAAGENQDDETVSGNESPSGLEEMEVIELSNGLYAYVTTEASRDYAIAGITEWIRIQAYNPEEGYSDVSAFEHSHRRVIIPNLYGTVTEIRMDDYSEIYISYEDKDGENGQAVIPLDFKAVEENAVEPAYRWEPNIVLCYNIEELTGNADFPKEVWSETFTSGGEEYTAVYSRVSPMYKDDIIEGPCFAADYQFAIRQGDETVYEIKLYEMSIGDEEVHYMEDVNGDGVEDFIQMNNPSFYTEDAIPYVFVWDQEQETCIYGGRIEPEEKASYDGLFNVTPPYYETVRYDRDTGIFYDFNNIVRHSYYRDDIHGLVILCGAKFIDGEWKTVYELYLGKSGEDYAREIRYDGEGNVISEITCTEGEHYDLANAIHEECELELFGYDDYTREEIRVNPQFSYWKYVKIEE